MVSVKHTHFHDSLIWDGHSGFTAIAGCQLDSLLQPWLDAGFDVLSINVYYDPQAWTDATRNIESFCSRLPDVAPYCKLAPTINEIDQTKVNGGLAVYFDIEGMNALTRKIHKYAQSRLSIDSTRNISSVARNHRYETSSDISL